MKTAKRAVCLFLAAAAVITLLCGCGFLGGKPTVYSSEYGLELTMPEGMVPFASADFDVAYAADEVIMTAVRERFEDYEGLELDLGAMSCEEYARLTGEINGLEQPFATDAGGNLFVTYTSFIDGREYFYYSTVRKGSDAFWLITFACAGDKSEVYTDAFEQWSASVKVS